MCLLKTQHWPDSIAYAHWRLRCTQSESLYENVLSPKLETEKLNKLQFTLPPSCSLFVSLSLSVFLSLCPPTPAPFFG